MLFSKFNYDWCKLRKNQIERKGFALYEHEEEVVLDESSEFKMIAWTMFVRGEMRFKD